MFSDVTEYKCGEFTPWNVGPGVPVSGAHCLGKGTESVCQKST